MIFLLVILFPLIQNQWLNLYLFDINNFTIYQLLYYLSGLIFPIFVFKNSLNNFTYYKFNNNKIINNIVVSGKLLLIISILSLFILSTLISSYLLINFKLIFNLFISDYKFLINFDIDKQILFVLLTSILLLFNKLKFILKKVILINFLIISFTIWYSKINDILIDSTFLINNFPKFDNLNSFNIFFLLTIELVYYIWSYISYNSYLSDWIMPIPQKKYILSILYIIFFYLMIIVYYSILSN